MKSKTNPVDPQVNVLIVDDVPANLLSLGVILESPEYRVLSASSGQEALNLALHEELAAVLLDVTMPEMDGFEVAEHLKRFERTRYIPILFVTAVANEIEHAFRAYAIGAVDYLTKPFAPEVVRRKVQTFVELFKQRKQIEEQARELHLTQEREHELHIAELHVASDRRYRKFVEGIDHVIAWAADPQTLALTFISSKAEQVFGWPMSEISLPDFWLHRLHPADKPLFLASVGKALSEGGDHTCNHRMIAADGRILWFHTGVNVDTALGQSKVELSGVSTDITDLKGAEETAQLAIRAREELIAIVSHDLRSPLQSLKLSAEMLARLGSPEDRTPEKLSEIAGRMLRVTASMDRLVNSLLDMDMIGRSGLRVERRLHDAKALALDCVEMLEPLARDRGVTIEVAVDPVAQVKVIGDRDRVRQVFANVIVNAIRFSPKGEAIRVRGYQTGKFVRFEIEDKGPGIAPEARARIFEAYWHADGGTKQAGASLGLGLAIAKGIVAAHGGEIGVTGEPGEGSTFFFTLPTEGHDTVNGRTAIDA